MLKKPTTYTNSEWGRTCDAQEIIYEVPLDASNSKFDKSKEN